NAEQKALRRKTHETIGKASDDIGRRTTFNTAIAAVMELTNTVSRFHNVSDDIAPQDLAVVREALEACVLLLAPITPHACHALWAELGYREPAIDAPWPQADEAAMIKDTVELVVQVNGKLRARIEAASDAAKEVLEAQALDNENVQRHIDGKTLRKVIVVPGKLVNIVAN
ncbi:MAG TPA: class I tRNA ligase family protein, partial [Modicisalibacter sp.]|nr:class I tRNA ligase family protein [Modicisalibacter sp.]